MNLNRILLLSMLVMLIGMAGVVLSGCAVNITISVERSAIDTGINFIKEDPQ